ncbi:MAG: hypothetical protein ACRDWN_06815, partial [Acidimicrobiales bacterium]
MTDRGPKAHASAVRELSSGRGAVEWTGSCRVDWAASRSRASRPTVIVAVSIIELKVTAIGWRHLLPRTSSSSATSGTVRLA